MNLAGVFIAKDAIIYIANLFELNLLPSLTKRGWGRFLRLH
jgi:hypothetical protein